MSFFLGSVRSQVSMGSVPYRTPFFVATHHSDSLTCILTHSESQMSLKCQRITKIISIWLRQMCVCNLTNKPSVAKKQWSRNPYSSLLVLFPRLNGLLIWSRLRKKIPLGYCWNQKCTEGCRAELQDTAQHAGDQLHSHLDLRSWSHCVNFRSQF